MLQKNRKTDTYTSSEHNFLHNTIATLICQVPTLVTSTDFENQHGQVQKIKVAAVR